MVLRVVRHAACVCRLSKSCALVRVRTRLSELGPVKGETARRVVGPDHRVCDAVGHEVVVCGESGMRLVVRSRKQHVKHNPTKIGSKSLYLLFALLLAFRRV